MDLFVVLPVNLLLYLGIAYSLVRWLYPGTDASAALDSSTQEDIDEKAREEDA